MAPDTVRKSAAVSTAFNIYGLLNNRSPSLSFRIHSKIPVAEATGSINIDTILKGQEVSINRDILATNS
ncbi:MAG: hypothetical protein HC789_23690 [Microcoleus sp. CSU_2_2]|nr:hypothetical protein [Microcoleus sp. CSU_2_2]